MSQPPQSTSPRPTQRLGFLGFRQGLLAGARTFYFTAALMISGSLLAETTNATALPPLTAPPLPEAGVSIIRVTGALALVIGLFLTGVWFFKNWQRLALRNGQQPKLNIVETRSLGARQAVVVVGYDKQRFLVATSPAGINLLSHLPDAEPAAEPTEKAGEPLSFGQALSQVLKKK